MAREWRTAIQITDVSKTTATHVEALVTLPAGAVVSSTQTDPGSGCTSGPTATQLRCALDFLSGSAAAANITIVLTLPQPGSATLTATASADQADTNATNNTASATVDVASPSPQPTPNPQPVTRPILKQVRTRTLSGISHGATETVDGSFTANEALTLTLTVTARGSATRFALLKGTRFAGASARSTIRAVSKATGHAGTFNFHLVFAKRVLSKGKTYVVHISARNEGGRTTALVISFRV